MDVKVGRRVSERLDMSVLHQRQKPYVKREEVCYFWLAGKCNRNPCPYLHVDVPHSKPQKLSNQLPSKYNAHTGFGAKSGSLNHVSPKSLPKSMKTGRNNTWRNPNPINKKLAAVSPDGAVGSKVDRDEGIQKRISNTEGAGDVSCQAVSSDLSTQDGAQFETEQKVHEAQPQQCKYWVTENCVHGEGAGDVSCQAVSSDLSTQDGAQFETEQKVPEAQPQQCKYWVTENCVHGEGAGDVSCQAVSSDLSTQDGAQFETEQKVHEAQPQQCKYWVTENCVHGDRCKDLHSWFSGSGFSMLAKLEGHSKAVSGVVLPIGSDKLFSGSKDESLRVWDCHSGQCVNKITVESEIQCMLSEGPWVFAGLKKILKAWNFQTQTEYVLSGPKGVVHALAASDDVIFAGVEDGTIWAWKFNSGPGCPEFLATLTGHSLAVISLVFGANRLYSGSKDNTIRIWDLENLHCMETVTGHSDIVTSLLCWHCYLLSGSLDNTLKVWATSQSGKLEVVHEVKEESGVVTLGGIMDAENKPILLCSYKEGTVRLYDLPSFAERGRIFAKREIQTIGIGCDGLFFTGDTTGQLSVWRLDGEFKAEAS